jgi:hypothetical protein
MNGASIIVRMLYAFASALKRRDIVHLLNNRKSGWGQSAKITGFFVGCALLGCAGNIYLKTVTGDKPIETYILHEMAGRNDLEKTYSEEKTNLVKAYLEEKTSLEEQIKTTEAIKSQLESQNKYLETVISRGNTRKTKPVLDYDKLKCPRYLVELMERMSASHGFPSIATVYCISEYESQFDPTCWNQKGEDSRGLLQINVKDKAHAKRNPNKTKLFDPSYNLDYQLNELKIYYDKGKAQGLTGASLINYTARYGQRPKWDAWIETRIAKTYKEYLSAVIKE